MSILSFFIYFKCAARLSNLIHVLDRGLDQLRLTGILEMFGNLGGFKPLVQGQVYFLSGFYQGMVNGLEFFFEFQKLTSYNPSNSPRVGFM